MNEILDEYTAKAGTIQVINQHQRTKMRGSKEIIECRMRGIVSYHEFSEELLDFLLGELYK